MAENQNKKLTGSDILLLIVSWLWAGIPLIWGVSQTFVKAAALFK